MKIHKDIKAESAPLNKLKELLNHNNIQYKEIKEKDTHIIEVKQHTGTCTKRKEVSKELVFSINYSPYNFDV